MANREAAYAHASLWITLILSLTIAPVACDSPDNAPLTTAPFTIEQGGNAGLYTDIAVDGDGVIHIAYFDLTNQRLRHAWRDTHGTWHTETIDAPPTDLPGTSIGAHTSIAIGPNEVIHIVYQGAREGTMPEALRQTLKHASKHPGNTWITEWVEDSPAIANIDGGDSTSLVIGSDGTLHASFHDAGSEDLLYARKEPVGPWYAQVIDGNVPGSSRVGQFGSIGMAPNGRLHVAYYDADNHHLKHAIKPVGMAWQTNVTDGQTTPNQDVGMFASLDIASDNTVHVSYFDNSEDAFDLKHAHRTPEGTWYTETVDGTDPNEMVGQHTSLVVASDDSVHIIYSQNNEQDLMWAKQTGDGEWLTQTVDSNGSLGMHLSITEGPSGLLHIAYYEQTVLPSGAPGGNLKYVSIAP